MKKVLMLGSDSSVKGGITSVINQIRAHDWKKEDIKLDFIPTYISANAFKTLLFYVIAIIKFVCNLVFSRPDVVYIHMSYRGSFVRKYVIHRLCKCFKVNDIIHLHGSEFEKWYNSSGEKRQKQIRRLLKECYKIVVLGNEWNKRILKIEPSAKTEIVENTVNIPSFSVKWDDSCFKVVFMGVLIKRKGVSDLLEAIHLLKETGDIGNMRFVIAGTGEEETALKRRTSELKIEDYVEFAGWIDSNAKTELYKNCQAMVLPSYNEGLPVAILEAISYGMPVAATAVGDIASAVKDGYNGVLIAPGEIDALAKALMKISCKENFEFMTKNSKALAQECFSDEKYFAKLAEIFN